MPKITIPPWMAHKIVAARDTAKAEAAKPRSKAALILVAIWIVAGIMTMMIPRGQFNSNRQGYYNAYGRYVEYENQQRQYEQQQNGNNNNGNGNYYSYPTCAWYQWQCRKKQYYYRMQMQDNNDQIRTPDWYRFIGGRAGDGEEDDRFYEEMGMTKPEDPSATGAVKFVFTWSQILFVLLLVYGVGVLLTGRSIVGLVVCMLFFAQFSLLNLLLLGQGVIRTDGRMLEDSVYGWAGQLPILMAYMDLAYVLFCLGFCGLFFVLWVIHKVIAHRLGGGGAAVDSAVAGKEGADGEYTTPGVYKTLDESSRPAQEPASGNPYNSMA